MIAGINEYILGRDISTLPDDSVAEFRDYQYDRFRRDYGIKQRFDGEVFYTAQNRTFLGRECIHNVIAAVDSKIYKVMFRYITDNDDQYQSFRNDVICHLRNIYGTETELRKVDDFHSIYFWDGDFGNAIVDTDMLGTSLIYTSSMLRKRPFHWLWKLMVKR